MSDPDDEPMPLVAANVTISTTEMPTRAASANSPVKRHLDEQTVPNVNDNPKRIRYGQADDDAGGGSTTETPFPPSKRRPLTPPPLFDAAMVNRKVDRRQFRRVGPYILGPKIGHCPMENIVQYLAKQEGTDQFVQLKILTLCDESSASVPQQIEERQGKMLLHTELSVLSMLVGHPGAIQLKGWFKDTAYEEEPSTIDANTTVYTGRICPRIVLVLDCVWPHEYSAASQTYVNLQQHLIKVKRMSDRVALPIFRDIVANVEYLHQRNIIHRDLKLGNIQLNRHTNRTVITNFCLSKLLQGNEDPMHDQRGSPAYISPEVLTGRPYAGKPIDVWSLGVMLYMMVVGHLPFYENSPALLFKKIKAADYTFPTSPALSYDTTQLIRGMLQLSPQQRMTAEAVRQRVDVILESRRRNKSGEQTVPEFVPPPPVPLIAGAAGAESSSSSAVGSASKSAKPWTEGSLTMLPGSWLFRRGEQVVPDVDANKNAAGTSTSARVRSRDRKPFIRPSADIFGSHMTPLPMPSASTTTAAATMVLAAQPPTGNSIVPETSTPRQRSTHVLANIESVIERSRMRLISIERYIADADQNNATVTGRRIDVRQNPNYSALQLRHTVMDNNDSVNGRSRIVNRGISETAVLPGRVASNATGLAAPRVAVEPLAADADRDEAMRRLNHLVQSRRSNQRSMAASAQSPLTVVYNGLLVNTTQTVAPPDTANGASSSHSSASTANPNPVPVLLSTVGGPQTPRREPYFYPLDNFQPTAMHRFSVQRTMAAPAEPAPLSPPSLIPNMNVGASASQDICAAVRQLFQAVNETFIRGQLPMPLPDAQLLPFDGRVTAEFCAAVAGWLLSEYADNRLVAAVFGGNANADAVANVANVCVFLKSCGVVAHRQDADGAYRLRRGQPMEVRIFMTLLLQATGYSVSMFV